MLDEYDALYQKLCDDEAAAYGEKWTATDKRLNLALSSLHVDTKFYSCQITSPDGKTIGRSDKVSRTRLAGCANLVCADELTASHITQFTGVRGLD